MEQNGPQRKACDVCYRKRIRCDGQKPRCSHCVLYDSACTFQASSRKVKAPAKKRGYRRGGVDATLRGQLERLELSLSQAQQRIGELERLAPQSKNIAAAAVSNLPELYLGSFTKTGDATLELPPLSEVFSAAETYLKTVNSVLPLFRPEALLHRIRAWFEYRIDQRDRTATWAALNVVLALARRHAPADETAPEKNVAYFLNNAQSVLNEVIMSKADLLNVQVLVGMVMLFQATLDLKPAAILISVALRLAHELCLHTQSKDPEHLDPAMKLERERVFWIAYILDRDISMRTKQPPVQRQADIGIDWPSAEPQDEAGLVPGINGSPRFNFLLSRVKLAHIQSEIFEIMYSARAQTLDSFERLENMARLRRMLDDWSFDIPPQFCPSSILQVGEPGICRAFGILYSTHLACRTLVCQAHVMESAWLQRLQDFGRESAERGAVVPVPALPQGWSELIHESREYMRLFMGIEWKDPAFIWMTACTYISGSVCLIANNMFNPRHEQVENDKYLADVCFSFLEGMVDQVPVESLKKTRNAYEELLRYAHALRL